MVFPGRVADALQMRRLNPGLNPDYDQLGHVTEEAELYNQPADLVDIYKKIVYTCH